MKKISRVIVILMLGIGMLMAAMPNFNEEKVDAADLNSLAKQYSYVGTTFLYKWLATQHIRYNKFYEKNMIRYRYGKPEGIVIHETNDPGATAEQEALYFNRDWDKMYCYVHAFVDSKMVIQMMTTNYGVWGAGPIANDRFVQVELCRESDRDDFAKSINNDAIYAARILHRYDLTPINATHDGKGTVWSHLAVSKFLGGTDHGDPDGYFALWGYTMDDFFDLIKYYYDLQGGQPMKKDDKPADQTNPDNNITKVPQIKDGQSVLMHDAYVYNTSGKRTKTLRRAGTGINVLKSLYLGRHKFYQIGKNSLIMASNLDGKLRLLKHNSYLYDTVGLRIGKTKLLRGNSVKTYGSPISIDGTEYYAIGATQFVKVTSF